MADRSLWDGDVPWVTPKDMKRFTISAASMNVSAKALQATSLRLIPAGSVLLVVRGMILARRVPVARTDQPVTINQDMKAIVPATGIDAGYLAYRLDAAQAAFAPMIDESGHGTKRLPTERWKDLQLAAPPLDEQRLIVRFLDWYGGQTSKLIRAKMKFIALLKEQKRAIIHRAVTRGLDPGVKLKPSGVAWLGDVPETWEILPLKRITDSRCDGPFGSGLKSSHYTSFGVLVIRLQNIGMGVFKRSEPAYISPEHYQSLGEHSVFGGDVLIAGLGDERHPCGRACVAPADLSDAMVKADCFRFRLKLDRADSNFIAASLSATAQASSAILSAGATRQRVNLQSTADRSLALPSLNEQGKIVRHIVAVDEEFRQLLDFATREIALLEEFHTRLIADVVTGKLDIRAAALNLKDELEVAPEDAEMLADVEDSDDEVLDSEETEAAA